MSKVDELRRELSIRQLYRAFRGRAVGRPRLLALYLHTTFPQPGGTLKTLSAAARLYS